MRIGRHLRKIAGLRERQQRRKRNTPGPPGFNSSQQIGAWDKRARGLARGDIQFEEATRLRTANSNVYLQSLLEPELQLGIGVPDDITLKTSILHLDERFDVTTDAAGCAAFTMFPGIKQFLRVFGTTGGLGVTWADTANLDATEATPIVAGYGQYRPVSASMEFVPTQSQNNDQGEVTVGLRPECDDLAGITVSASTSFLEDHDVVAMKHGCRVIWAPRDPKDQEYQLTSANVNDGGSGTATGSIMVIAISGAQASVKIGSLHIVMNLEAIPVTGGFFAKSSSSSPSCSPAVDHARNVVAAPGM